MTVDVTKYLVKSTIATSQTLDSQTFTAFRWYHLLDLSGRPQVRDAETAGTVTITERVLPVLES